jgi:hypothetical protein
MNAITEKRHLLETVAPNDAVLASMPDEMLGAMADQYRQKLSGYRSKLQELERRNNCLSSADEISRQRESITSVGCYRRWKYSARLRRRLRESALMTRGR